MHFATYVFFFFFLALDEGDIALLKTYVSIYYICTLFRRNKKIKVVLQLLKYFFINIKIVKHNKDYQQLYLQTTYRYILKE